MLVADSISFQGRHSELVPPTSLRVAPGEMLLVAGEPQGARTALALLLSGRMKPGGGVVAWGGSARLAHLRKHSAVVDSPNINDPEAHLKVRDVVSEDLSLIPSPPWRKPNPKKWMAEHGYSDIAGDWVDAVDPVRLTEMLMQLAAENPQTRLLVVDSPDRHPGDDAAWLEALERFALSDREFAVIATVARVPESWAGPVAYLGASEPAAEFEPEPELEPAPDAEPEEPSEDPSGPAPTEPDEQDRPDEQDEQDEPTAEAPQPEPGEPAGEPSAAGESAGAGDIPAEPGMPEEQDTPAPAPQPASDPSQAKD
ncbi:ABC transporter ATP-binding protein [Glutamicibacter protophormiae]|uniref:ABC transporter ATP-binding protein n=1 Tax=Glutamicibacter protophormiae TaxID=37930 RepID=UPI003BAEBC53